MDYNAAIQKLKAKMASIPADINTLAIEPVEWDDELNLPHGSTATHLEKALKGTRYSIAVRDHVMRLVRKRAKRSG
jgi:hypothetical protein